MNSEQVKQCIQRTRHNYHPEEARYFDNLLQMALRHPVDLAVKKFPKHRFLSYLTDEKGYLAHGSPLHDITALKPIRSTSDQEETGHENLLLAASDGIWAMWYAILDKSRMGAITCNNCIVRETVQGDVYSLYYFAVDHSAMDRMPYGDGTVYIVETAQFNYHQGQEYGSNDSVEPLFGVRVGIGDFPYVPYIKGVDVAALKQALLVRPGEAPFLTDESIFPVSPEIPFVLREMQIQHSEH